MFRKLFLVSLFAFIALAPAFAQKKEISQAKSAIKAGNAVEAEASMRKLLADSAHRQNEKIWLVLFDAVKKQYEDVNEKMYLKQSTDTANSSMPPTVCSVCSKRSILLTPCPIRMGA